MTDIGWQGVGLHLHGDERLIAEVTRELPPFFEPVSTTHLDVEIRSGDPFISLWFDGEQFVELPDAPDCYRAFASRIELHLVERLPDYIAVHAGVVVRNGRALLVPGGSRAGKSTLVRALMDCGADYFSDEYALIDGAGRVHPYPRALTMRTTEQVWRIDATTLPETQSASLALIADLRFDPEHEPQHTELSRSELALTLLLHCVPARRAPQRSLDAITTAAQLARGFHGTRGEAQVTAPWLLEQLNA